MCVRVGVRKGDSLTALGMCAQGDREMALGLPVGPIHDRRKTSIPKSQTGFIDFITLPLWETWDDFVGHGSVQLTVRAPSVAFFSRWLANPSVLLRLASDGEPQ